MQLTTRLLKWCDRKAIRLVPVHLPGMRNVQADALSRMGQTLNTEWTFTMECLRPVFTKWCALQIDMFATSANRRLIKFVSPFPDPRAEWTDAMSTTWDNGRGLLYVFPPFKLVPQVLRKIYQSHGTANDSGSSQARNSFLVSGATGTVARRSDPAVRRRSAPSHPRRHSARRRNRNMSLPAVKSTRVETLRAILRAKGHSREAADMMSISLRQSWLQLYESHWGRFVHFCRTKRWEVFNVRSRHFSTYLRRIASIDHYFTSHISGFCAASLEVRSCSRSAHQAAHQGIQAGMTVQRRIMPKWDLNLVL